MNYNVFIYCGGKAGSSTLHKTFIENNFKVLKQHNICDNANIFDIIEESSKHNDTIYIIDSYRTPIERKISSFFQNISLYLPDYSNYTVDELILFFNENLIYSIEEYHSIDEILNYYQLPLFDEFDFSKKYVMKQHNNIKIIKVLFNNINEWNEIFSTIFEKDIVFHNDNLTQDKPINLLYNEFKREYNVPVNYLNNQLLNDKHFQIYNTHKDKREYIKKWLNKSY